MDRHVWSMAVLDYSLFKTTQSRWTKVARTYLSYRLQPRRRHGAHERDSPCDVSKTTLRTRLAILELRYIPRVALRFGCSVCPCPSPSGHSSRTSSGSAPRTLS